MLRGISITIVLLHHFNIAYRLADTLPAQLLGWNAVRAVTRNGNYGVTMFFVISGFLITDNAVRRWGSLADVNPRIFYRLRASRIFPCALLLVVVVNLLALCGLAIFQNHPETGAPVSLWLVDLAALSFWMNVLVAQHGWLNYVLCVQWSLAVEEVFYLGFPLLCVLLRRESRLLFAWAIFIAIGPIWRAFHQDDDAGALYAYFACFDAIAIGCCAAVLCRRITVPGRWSRAFRIVVGAGMAILYLAGPISETNVWGVTVMALGTAALILTLQTRPAAIASSGLLATSGRLSYEIYLFHLVVLGVLRTVFPPDTTAGNAKLALLIAYLALSVGLSAVIARYYSNRLNRRFREGRLFHTGRYASEDWERIE